MTTSLRRQLPHALLLLALLGITARCTRAGPTNSTTPAPTLRIGFAEEADSTSALNGIQQLRQILSVEGLARIGEDGRPVPGLAEGWTVAPDGLSMKIRLRPAVKFHDGSAVDAINATKALQQVLPGYMGPAFSDVDHITATGNQEIDIGFRRPSPFLLEALEAPIQKPGASGVGTGPYMVTGSSAPNEMRANPSYYLGKPPIDRIVVVNYPNVRSAWAEMLRGHVDMLYDVGTDAFDSLSSAKNVSVFTYVRHYQYELIFNTTRGPLRSRDIRRALNQAIDLKAVVRDGFDGHAIPSSGPIWPRHWASSSDLPRLSFDPQAAAATLGSTPARVGQTATVRFKCLVRPSVERIALVIKHQLEAVGVDMAVEEAPLDSILQAMSEGNFDAVLGEPIGGPNLSRPYGMWHSGGFGNSGALGSPQLDAALDRVRYATNDDEYRSAVLGLQKAVVDNPPAIFLAWSERARAVSNRFQVPAEPKDILTTLRLWRPVNAGKAASRN